MEVIVPNPGSSELLVNFFIRGLGFNMTWTGKCLLCGRWWNDAIVQSSQEAMSEIVRHVQTAHRVSNHLTHRTAFAWSLEEPQEGHIRGALWTQPRPV